jgi:hypothetical protein
VSSPVDPPVPPQVLRVLDAVAAEIETHLATSGWDQPPALFALVPTRLILADPNGAQLLGLGPDVELADDSLTPVVQDNLPDSPLDEMLAGIEWPDAVTGCALAQEILILPPEAEAELSDRNAVDEAVRHPDRREARLVVAVLRDGSSASVLRLRGRTEQGETDEIAFGADLAPNLVDALAATLQ